MLGQYEQVNVLIKNDRVEKYFDSYTGLEVFSYKRTNDGPKQYLEDICRGLVLHPPSKTVVATPFTRFYKPSDSDIEERGDHLVRATVKFDGSLIIAFKWQGQIYATTRRRMDSEQALWATNYLRNQSQSTLDAIEPGCTFCFELIGGDNLHVIPYSLNHTLVLLTIFDNNGKEYATSEMMKVAKKCSFMVTPSLYGSLNSIREIVKNSKESKILPLDDEDNGNVGSTSQRRKIDVLEQFNVSLLDHESNISEHFIHLCFEGFVIEDQTDGKRFKLIHNQYERSKHWIKQLLNPVTIWSFIKSGLFEYFRHIRFLPRHVLDEVDLIACAIVEQVKQVFSCYLSSASYQPWKDILKHKKDGDIYLENVPCCYCGCIWELDVNNDRICFCDSCYGSGRSCQHILYFDNRTISERNSPCNTCGCMSEYDIDGERVCFCDSCYGQGLSCRSGHSPDEWTVTKFPENIEQDSIKAAYAKGDIVLFSYALDNSGMRPNSTELVDIATDIIKKAEGEAVAEALLRSIQLTNLPLDLSKVEKGDKINTRKIFILRALFFHTRQPSIFGDLKNYRPSPWYYLLRFLQYYYCKLIFLFYHRLGQTFAKGWNEESFVNRARRLLGVTDALDQNNSSKAPIALLNDDVLVNIFSFLFIDLTHLRQAISHVYTLDACINRYGAVISGFLQIRRTCRIWNRVVLYYFGSKLQEWYLIKTTKCKLGKRGRDESDLLLRTDPALYFTMLEYYECKKEYNNNGRHAYDSDAYDY